MTRYDNHPSHPLAGVPQEALDAAMEALKAAAMPVQSLAADNYLAEVGQVIDVEDGDFEPVAHAVLAAALAKMPKGPVLGYVVKHPDGTDCPEYSYPFQGPCPLAGTGAHHDFLRSDKSYAPSAVTQVRDILTRFIGPIDVPHLAETGTYRRVLYP